MNNKVHWLLAMHRALHTVVVIVVTKTFPPCTKLTLSLSLTHSQIMRFMGFYSKNLMEWVIASQACNLHGVVVVPLYDTLGADAVEMIVAETGMTSIVCSGEELATVAEVAPRTPSLKNVVVMKTASPTRDAKWLEESMAKLEAAGLTVHAFAGVEEAGAEDPQDAPTVDPDDVATFCYTSGTTGKPKGTVAAAVLLLPGCRLA